MTTYPCRHGIFFIRYGTKVKFKPGTEVKKQEPKAKGYNATGTHTHTKLKNPQQQNQYDNKPQIISNSSLVIRAVHKLALQKP